MSASAREHDPEKVAEFSDQIMRSLKKSVIPKRVFVRSINENKI
jgi:hypothetical protein